ncbi:MAG: YeiH family protein [Flavobacteriales bacterium]
MFKQSHLSGFSLAVIIGLLAHFLAPTLGLNGIILGLFSAIFLGNVWKIPERFQAGISITGSKLLESSIVFLAFNISLGHVIGIGWQSLLLVIVMIVLILFVTIYLSSKFHCPGSTGWLVGFGTAICGSSAIAAVAPSISKNKEDVGIALAVVNLMGSIGMISLPFVLQWLSIDDLHSGVIIGGSLHAVGNVAGAGYALSEETGQVAITIKLARVALLSPSVIFFSYLINRKEAKNWKEHFKLPLYLVTFIAITLITTFIDIPTSFTKVMELLGKISLTIAMTAIGLKISFRELYQSGRKALGFGAMIFMVQITIIVMGLAFVSRL